MLDQALAQGIDSIAEPPRALAELFAQVDREPIWLDRDKLALACRCRVAWGRGASSRCATCP